MSITHDPNRYGWQPGDINPPEPGWYPVVIASCPSLVWRTWDGWGWREHDGTRCNSPALWRRPLPEEPRA